MMKASCTIILIVAQQLLVHFTGNQFFPPCSSMEFFLSLSVHLSKSVTFSKSDFCCDNKVELRKVEELLILTVKSFEVVDFKILEFLMLSVTRRLLFRFFPSSFSPTPLTYLSIDIEWLLIDFPSHLFTALCTTQFFALKSELRRKLYTN